LGDFSSAIPTGEDGQEQLLSEIFLELPKVEQWLLDNKTVSLIAPRLPNFRDTALPLARRMAELLKPKMDSGQLKLAKNAGIEKDAPRAAIINDTKKTASLIYSHGLGGSLLENLFWEEGRFFEKKTDLKEAENSLPKLDWIDSKQLERPDSIRRVFYKPNEERRLEEAFDFLKQGELLRLEILDRYLVADRHNRESLEGFLIQLSNIWDNPPKSIILKFGPTRPDDDQWEWEHNLKEITSRLTQKEPFKQVEFKSSLRKYTREGNFHDRWIKAVFNVAATEDTPDRNTRRRRIGNSTPTKKTIIVELTGGITYLMDSRKETRAYVFEETVAGH
jgi:hypothetical protein